MDRAQTLAPPPQTPQSRATDTILRQNMLRQRKPFGGGGARLETGNTVDTTILGNSPKLTLGGTG